MIDRPSSPIRLLVAVTSPLAWNFYRGALTHLSAAGFAPILLSAPGENLTNTSTHEGVPSVTVSMEREIAPFHDLISLWNIYRAIRRLRPTIVDASTPKAGLLGMIAAWLARVPCRVYTLRGLRLETATGMKRAVLWGTERVACVCSHRVVCVSPSLRTRAIALNLVSPEKATVLAHGSGGVDLARFYPGRRDSADSRALRMSLGIPSGVPVIGFVGRFVRDKGMHNLVEAFGILREHYPDLRLLLVGDFEEGDCVEPEVRRFIESDPAIVRPGFVNDTAPYYALMDVLVLPTFREGFPGVPLEAQASAVPVVTTTATGAVDSVVDGTTGILVPVGDSDTLAKAIARLLADPELRTCMGLAGRERMERDFHPQVVWDALTKLYRQLMSQNIGPPAAFPLASRCSAAKRAFDLVFAITGLMLLSPLLAAIAIVIRACLGSPILFRQERAGLNGSLFHCLKFRTMMDARDKDGQLLPDAERLTPLGQLLRSTSLDELPELINVIRGEMSLVGPRPLLSRYLERYSPEQMRRHAMRPGITGWAQINGRNALDWKRKFELDVWYVDNWTLGLDAKLLLQTVWKTFRKDGISQPGHATMEEFTGAK